jgi:peroxiredoxin
MKTLHALLACVAFTAIVSTSAHAAKVGQPAPAFTLTDLNGTTHSLADFKGKTVVLEWVNPDCPFVRKHYDKSGNLPATQKAAVAGGTVWLLVNSAAPGAQGDYSPDQAKAWLKKHQAAATAYLRDPAGTVGKLYDARTTPHMYVIDPAGTLVYAGAIDSNSSSKSEDIAKATNYVNAALADLKAGKPVAQATTKPYGCSVKYAK